MLARGLTPIAAAGLLAAACSPAPQAVSARERPALGLMTTLPLIWAEAADIGEQLNAHAKAGWVRQGLDGKFRLEPLDTLDQGALARVGHLVLAQPRPLSPEENVALDSWVRGGGRLLLFADPMLTQHSRFAVGDPRRPQDVALLSPILGHWGLELVFDDAQTEGERTVEIEGAQVPLNLAGSFRLAAGSPCALAGGGVLARCRIGKGQVIVLADAAVLEDADSDDADMRRAALGRLLAFAFEQSGISRDEG